MKIQLCSDLHLDQINFYSNENLVYPEGDVLVLAGDICHVCEIEKHSNFFKYLDDNFQYIVYVPGNHEFYNDSWKTIGEHNKK